MNQFLLSSLSILISTIAFLIILHNINPYKFTWIDYILLTLSILILCVSSNIINEKLSSMIFYTVPIIYLYIKCKKLFKSILIQITSLLIVILSDSIIGLIISNTLGESFTKSLYGYIFTCCFIFIFAYLISKGIFLFFKEYSSLISEYLKSKYSIFLYIVLILTFTIFYININWNISYDHMHLRKTNGLLFLLYGILMITISIILSLILKKDYNFKIKEIQMNNLKEYTDNLENLYMDMRKFRHDYINIISSMAGFIEDKDFDGLEKHFNENIYPLNKKINKNNYKLGLLKNILMPEIKGLLSAKIIRAQELGIDVILEIAEPIDNINLNIIDLSRCLGIILDNAIEASLDSKKKIVTIAFIKKGSSIIIIISNSFTNNNLIISKIYKPGFSTKGENRGLGLSNLKEILSNYNNVSLDTYIDNNIFTQNITINAK